MKKWKLWNKTTWIISQCQSPHLLYAPKWLWNMRELETYWGTSLGSGFSTKYLHLFFFSDCLIQSRHESPRWSNFFQLWAGNWPLYLTEIIRHCNGSMVVVKIELLLSFSPSCRPWNLTQEVMTVLAVKEGQLGLKVEANSIVNQRQTCPPINAIFGHKIVRESKTIASWNIFQF